MNDRPPGRLARSHGVLDSMIEEGRRTVPNRTLADLRRQNHSEHQHDRPAALFFRPPGVSLGAAACAGLPTDMFFATDPTGALAVCATCSCIDECLAYATNTLTSDGVWGGKQFVRGKAIQS